MCSHWWTARCSRWPRSSGRQRSASWIAAAAASHCIPRRAIPLGTRIREDGGSRVTSGKPATPNVPVGGPAARRYVAPVPGHAPVHRGPADARGGGRRPSRTGAGPQRWFLFHLENRGTLKFSSKEDSDVLHGRVPFGGSLWRHRSSWDGVALWSQPAARQSAPVIGKSVRYCNPLPVASSKDGRRRASAWATSRWCAKATSTICSEPAAAPGSPRLGELEVPGGHVRGGRLPVAPHVVKYNGAFYMSGNSAPLYRAPDILGPYEVLGPWKDEKGEPWTGRFERDDLANGAFDVDIFVDDDNKPYLYYPADRPTDLCRAARPERSDPVRRRAQAPVRLRPIASLGALGREERVYGRRLDRGPLGVQTQRHLLPGIQRLRHAVAVAMRAASTRRGARWGRSRTRREIRCCGRLPAS